MRLIGLDLGTKKCGIAISDPLQIIAQPLKVIFYEKQNFSYLIEEIKNIINKYNPIEKIILGIPKNELNKTNSMEKIVLKFHKILVDTFKEIEIILIDESHSSKESDKVMQLINLTNKKKKANRDKIAAQKILENYIFYKK